MSNPPEDNDNRRTAARHVVYVGAEIEAEGGRVRSAVTHDASATGVLLLTRAYLEPNQVVTLHVALGRNAPTRSITGRVVRREALAPGEVSLWREKVAIALDPPQPDLAAELEALARAQAAIYGDQG